MSDSLANIRLQLDYSDVDAFTSSVSAAVDRLEGLRGRASGRQGAGGGATSGGGESARADSGLFIAGGNRDAELARANRLNSQGTSELHRSLAEFVDKTTGARLRSGQQSTILGGSSEFLGNDARARQAAQGLALQQRLAAQRLGLGSEPLRQDLGAKFAQVSAQQEAAARRAAAQGAQLLRPDISARFAATAPKPESSTLRPDLGAKFAQVGAQQSPLLAAQQKLADVLNQDAIEAQQLRETTARLVVAQEAQAKAQAEATAAARRASGQGIGFGQGGTRYQQFEGALRARRGGDTSTLSNSNFSTLGERAGRELGYAVPGLAIGAGIEELRASVQEAEKAQEALAQVNAEFSALGQGSQFSGFANSIKDISNSTGLAVSEVADLGLAMKGVYGNTAQAEIALTNVSQAAVAMGLSVKEAQQDLTAITQSFAGLQNSGGAGIQAVSNEALHLQDLTGVSSKGILAGTADAAASANQVGLSSNQTASIVAAASQRSGLDPTVIGQTLSKLVDGLTQNLGGIIGIYQQDPRLKGEVGKFSTNTSAQNLQMVIKDLGTLNTTNPGEAIALQRTLGINSSAVPSLNALTSTGAKAQKLEATTAPVDRTTEEFNKQMSSLQGTFERLRAEATNLGVSLIDGPFGSGLKLIANGLGDVAHVFSEVATSAHGMGLEFGGLLVAVGGLKAIGSIKSQIDSFKTTSIATQIDALTVAIKELGNTAEGAAAKVGADDAAVAGEGAGGGIFGLTGGLAGRLSGPLSEAGLGTSALGVGAAGLAGYGLGTQLYNSAIKGSGAEKSVQSFLATNLFGGSGGPSANSKKYEVQQTSWVDQHIKPIKALEKIANPQDKARLQGDVKNADEYGSYMDLLQEFSKVGDTKEGQAAIQSTKSPAERTKAAATARATAIKALATQQQDELQDWAGIQTGYQAGAQSFSTLLQSANLAVQAAQAAYHAQGTGGTQPEFEALQTAIANKNQILDQLAQEQQQFQQSIQQQGAPSSDIANIASLAGENLKSPDARLSRTQAIISAYQQEVQDEASFATTTAQRNAILQQGIQVSGKDLATINADRASNNLAPVSSLTIKGNAVTPQQQIQAFQEQAQAQQALAQAQAFSDPVKEAQAAVQSANAQMQQYLSVAGTSASDPAYQQLQAAAVTANHQLIDANNAINQARLGYLATLSARDPIQAAQYSMQQAQAAYASAHGAAAQYAALQQQAQAQQQENQSIIDLADAKSSILQGVAGVKGNPIGQALLVYQQALQDVATQTAQDKTQHINPQTDTSLQQKIAQTYQNQAAYMQAIASTTIQNTQTQLFLGQITSTQAITNLEGALVKVKGNYQQTQTILQEIRTIQNTAGANLNFDLPTNLLTNPTLYTARRTEANANAGYNDNRQVSVVVNVNNASDNSKGVQALLNAVGTPSRSGTNGPTLP